MKTLQEQFNLIKEGKGNKGVFLKEAKRNHSNIISNINSFDETVNILKQKNIISENYVDLQPINILEPREKESWETKFSTFLAEASKEHDEKIPAESKKVDSSVEEIEDHNFDYKDKKNPDNQVGEEILKGLYTELKNNPDMSLEEAKELVTKNLAKDPLHYVKEGQFGVEGLGYQESKNQEVSGDHKSSGYSDKLKDVVKESLMGAGIVTSGHKDSFASKSNEIIKDIMAEVDKEWGVQQEDINEEDETLPSDESVTNMVVDMNPMEEDEVIQEKPKTKAKKVSIHKRMSEIDKLGTALALEAKMDAIQEEIEMRESQISMIDENESMKELMDPKKLKELKNEIKLLERKKAKYQKMHERASKK
jgi:hypothetical protein